jgi:hypothetical protein
MLSTLRTLRNGIHSRTPIPNHRTRPVPPFSRSKPLSARMVPNFVWVMDCSPFASDQLR